MVLVERRPLPGGGVPFFLDMLDIVTGSLLALDCLGHVGTEGTVSIVRRASVDMAARTWATA
jgi:hypothetical protein